MLWKVLKNILMYSVGGVLITVIFYGIAIAWAYINIYLAIFVQYLFRLLFG